VPEIDGSYLLTLSVPEGDNTTFAVVAVRDPAGELVSPAPTPTGSGGGTAWSAALTVDMAGWWIATWTVTGAGTGVKSSRFYVTATPTGFGTWPPCLSDLKTDMGDRDEQDDSKDGPLSMVLDAAIAKVRDLKGDVFDLGGESAESGGELADPDADLILGTLRLAARWHTRRGSTDNLVSLGDAGSAVVPSYDSDIERLLRIGRFAPVDRMFA
jgi:hypothetical protein